ncbi:hypothetical protein HK101_000277, partial [Irineochytrium annulatum]
MPTDDLHALAASIEHAILAGTTSCSVRLRSSIRPGSLTATYLSPADAPAVGTFVATQFANEPFNRSCGVTPQEMHAGLGLLVASEAEHEVNTDKRTTVVIKNDGVVVACAVVLLPELPRPKVAPPESLMRMLGAIKWADARVGSKLEGLPKLGLGAVDPAFRGAIGDGEVLSIYQRVIAFVEGRLRACGYAGIFSHSNETSAERHRRDGWEVLLRCPYAELPREGSQVMGDREANALLREINATLDAPTTPASRRIAASVALLGPLTFHFVDPESASVATSLADFIGAGHLREPLGNAVGLTDPQHLACISTMVRDALRIDADRRSGSASLILRAGGVIVAAVMIAQPRGNTPEPTPGCDAEKRLYDAMAWADDRAREAFKAVTGLDLHETPELALSLVAQEFRGSLGDEGSIYQRMTRACEA